ncbi:hemicentin-1-like isoform X2 [Dreissena polymorpha]|uniref:Uncharacterized protein n=1 Tax=Dreissena polymorpha TaxID=45954 RepID=A0A9D4G5X6_DREPO|nr:hemicentin-1-like isoform X2 [Dreissena polymorpha]KAH3811021.1 hypothetical protein DPMN_139421 [Dreissena polymorpha]
MDAFVALFIGVLCVTKAANAQLQLTGGDAFINTRVQLECTLPNSSAIVTWHVANKGFNETVAVIQEYSNGKCSQSQNSYITCTCNITLFACATNTVKMSDDEQRWRCSASIAGTTMYSNTHIISVLIPLTYVSLFPPQPVLYPALNVSSNFTCITSKSRPGASIDWFENGHNITKNANYVYSSDVTSSILIFTPNAENTRNLTCIAKYLYKTTHIELSNTSILNIQYPVSKPLIKVNNSAVSDSVTILEGTSVDFKCEASGYPPPSYHWVFPWGDKEGAELLLQFNSSFVKGQVSCLANNTFVSLDGTTNTNSPPQQQVTFLTFDLIIPLQSVTLFPNTMITYPVHNVTSIYLCITSMSKPASTIHWFEDNVNITNMSTYAYNNYVATSKLSFIPKTHARRKLSCIANQLYEHTNRTMYTETELYVQFAVFEPKISLNRTELSDQVTLLEKRHVEFECSTSGYPLPAYQWMHAQGVTNGTIFAFQVNRTFTGENVSCFAINTFYALNGNTTAQTSSSVKTTQLNVLYHASITFAINDTSEASPTDNSISVLRGSSISIVCESDAHPPAMVSWIGKQTNSSTLRITNIQQDEKWTCQASNTINETYFGISEKSITKTLFITVLYPPTVQRFQNRSTVMNATFTVRCNLSSVGNPVANNFTWLRIKNYTTVGSEQVLVINNVARTDEGIYKCIASNTMQPSGNVSTQGYGESQFYLNVQYGARIQTFHANSSTNDILVDQYTSVIFVCEADGNPAPIINIVNTTAGGEIILAEKLGYVVTFPTHPVGCEYDVGIYKCQAHNIHTSALEEHAINVLVKCSPRSSPLSPPITTLYKAPSDSVVLTFTFKAYPKPNVSDITWSKRVGDRWAALSEETKYQISVSADTMQTNLTINYLDINDFSQYQVKVANILGSTTEVFYIHLRAKPDKPTSFRIKDGSITHNSLTVEWIPGDTGGANPWFVIRYRAALIPNWTDKRVPPTLQTSYTVEDLIPRTNYELKMFAENIVGKSGETSIVTALTLQDNKASPSTSSTIILVGAVVGGVVVGCVIAAIVVWRLRINMANKDEQDKGGDYADLVRPKSDIEKERSEDKKYESIDGDKQYDELGPARSNQKRRQADNAGYESVHLENNDSGSYVTLTEKAAHVPEYSTVVKRTVLASQSNAAFEKNDESPVHKKEFLSDCKEYFNLKLT